MVLVVLDYLEGSQLTDDQTLHNGCTQEGAEYPCPPVADIREVNMLGQLRSLGDICSHTSAGQLDMCGHKCAGYGDWKPVHVDTSAHLWD